VLPGVRAHELAEQPGRLGVHLGVVVLDELVDGGLGETVRPAQHAPARERGKEQRRAVAVAGHARREPRLVGGSFRAPEVTVPDVQRDFDGEAEAALGDVAARLSALVRPSRVSCCAGEVAEPELGERDAREWEGFEPRIVGGVRVLERGFEVRERVLEAKAEPVDDGEGVECPCTRLVLADRGADRDGALRELTPALDVALEPERVGHLGEQTRLETGIGERGQRGLERLERHSGAEAPGGQLGPGAVR